MNRQKDQFIVYIVKCAKGTYYTGYTNDIKSRIYKHNSGTGAKYLRGRGPVKLVYMERYHRKEDAMRAEIAIKKMKRSQKHELVTEYRQVNNRSI